MICKLQGFNLAPGGSMGATAGDPKTYPSLGDLIGFVTGIGFRNTPKAVANLHATATA
ncbi:hypothetical protein CDEF62S_00694 [Castellaniella defragrans]